MRQYVVLGLPFPHFAETAQDAVTVAQQGIKRYPLSSEPVIEIYRKIAQIHTHKSSVIEYVEQEGLK